MRRASAIATAVVVAASALVASATPKKKRANAPPPASQAAPVDHRDELVRFARAQLDAEADVLAKTRETIDGKVDRARTTRIERLRAAYRLVRAPEMGGSDAMATARVRAAARVLADRDRDERELLVAEAAHLTAAQSELAAATARVDALALPSGLPWPADGEIARGFGSYVHDRSHATLSRRGIDLEVDDHARAFAPADGVVRYAGPIRGLDRGVIVDCGDYLALVAKLGDPAVPVGAHVRAGDRLGRAARHRIYVEIRLKLGAGGVSVDPKLVMAPR